MSFNLRPSKRVSLSSEFKRAIADLPDKDKNKYLYRLLAQRPDLVEQLTFELIEESATTEERRTYLAEEIENVLDKAIVDYYSPGYLLLSFRFLSGAISRHLKTTKDKYGEIQLNFLMLNTALTPLHSKLAMASPKKAQTLHTYVVKRTLKLLKLLNQQHPDVHLDFKDDMHQLGDSISRIDGMMESAISHGLDVNWLVQGEVPEL